MAEIENATESQQQTTPQDDFASDVAYLREAYAAEEAAEKEAVAEPAPKDEPQDTKELASDEALRRFREEKAAERSAREQEERLSDPRIKALEAIKDGGGKDALLKALEAFGVSPEEFLESTLDKEDKDKPVHDPRVDALEKQLAEFREKERSRQEEAYLANMAREAESVVSSDASRWELLSRHGGYQQEVVDLIAMAAKEGKHVSYESAADLLEKALEARVEQSLSIATGSKRFADRFGAGSQPQTNGKAPLPMNESPSPALVDASDDGLSDAEWLRRQG